MLRRGQWCSATAWCLVTCAWFVAIASPTRAQTAGTLNTFRAAPTAHDDFQLSRPLAQGHQRFGARVVLDYAHNPLLFETDDGRELAVVDHQLNLNLGMSFGLVDRVVFYASLPVVALMQGDDPSVLRAVGAAVPDGAGVGDLTLGGRFRLLGDAQDRFALAAQLTVTLPTSGGDGFRGDDFITVRPEVLAELRPASARVVANLGAIGRRNTGAGGDNLAFSDELTFGLGGALPVWKAADPATALELHAQIDGATAFNSVFSRDRTSAETTVGAKLLHRSGIIAGLMAGPGLARGFGSPDLRVVAMVGFTETERARAQRTTPRDTDGDGLRDDADRCPAEAEDVDQFLDEDGCPDADNDADGTRDRDDQCPMQAGPFENGGCPDTDRDGDSIPDRLDRCVDEPEDFDDHEDRDGCPDPDNDGDGVLDAADRCRDEAGLADNGGCPDADRDGDTVVDRLDNCPDTAGSPEQQGCPTRQLVRIEEGRLDILDVVYFETGKDVIRARSFELLQNVGAVLNAHPEIEHVHIEGHTDSRGKRDKNVELSQRRAESVLRFLVDQAHVDAARLQAHGYGPDRPIVPEARNAADHARNRRVEFKIVGAAGQEQP